jgi:hypothetical protein
MVKKHKGGKAMHTKGAKAQGMMQGMPPMGNPMNVADHSANSQSAPPMGLDPNAGMNPNSVMPGMM